MYYCKTHIFGGYLYLAPRVFIFGGYLYLAGIFIWRFWRLNKNRPKMRLQKNSFKLSITISNK